MFWSRGSCCGVPRRFAQRRWLDGDKSSRRRTPGSLDAELDNESALDHGAVPEFVDETREKPVEDEKLAPAPEIDAADRRGP
jgi:hypothetical protein